MDFFVEIRSGHGRGRWVSQLAGMVLGVLALGSVLSASGQKPYGRGAMSAQDMRKMAAGPLASTGALACPDIAAGATITPPVDLHSVNGVLEVTLNLQTDVDASGRQRYCYVTPAGEFSPTLRVSPGDTLLIHFYNQIPAGLTPAMPAEMKLESSAHMQHGMAAGMQMTLHGQDTPATGSSPCDGGAMTASVSNLHFHGLNVSPTCHSDEVVNTLVQPGQEFDYTIQIPANEPAGLYWYHPHPHGFSEGQVQGGATGAIIVEGIQQANPALAGLTEQTLVLRDLLVPTSEQSVNEVPAWDISLNNVPVSFPSYTPAVVPVAPGQQQLWRILNSAADTIFNLQYVVGETAQPFSVVAIDGVPIIGGAVPQSSVLLPPGSRAEIVVTTPAVGQTAQLVTDYVNTGADGDYDPTRPIANIVATASAPALPVLPAVAKTKATARRFSAMAQATPVAQRTLYFSEQLEDPTDPNSPTTFFITQDGMTPVAFTMGQAPNIVVHSGTVEDWVIQNRALEDHIFHIHQIHFQVMAVNGVAVSDPAIRDTYDLPYWTGQGAYPSITVRMDFRDPNIVGNFVYHCHILQHEDSGMMGEIEVLPSSGAASTTVVAASAANTTPGTTSTLTATVTSTVAGGSTPTGQVQFQSNGTDIGNPVTLANGVATLSITGVLLQNGANPVQAFYLGDTFYAESLSSATTVTNAPFSLTGSGVAAAAGTAANAPLEIAIASGFTGAVQLSCSIPASLTEAACFVNPASVVGGGPVTLTVNTTPAHPSAAVVRRAGIWPIPAAVLAICLLPLLRRTRRVGLLCLVVFSGLVTLSGCSSGGSKAAADPGTAAGAYNVVVTAASTSGTTPYTVSLNVPITVQ
jgi:FtsP/CotA-like multicopper oxidase with cupredoxin domain/uncharacterized protein YceK